MGVVAACPGPGFAPGPVVAPLKPAAAAVVAAAAAAVGLAVEEEPAGAGPVVAVAAVAAAVAVAVVVVVVVAAVAVELVGPAAAVKKTGRKQCEVFEVQTCGLWVPILFPLLAFKAAVAKNQSDFMNSSFCSLDIYMVNINSHIFQKHHIYF